MPLSVYDIPFFLAVFLAFFFAIFLFLRRGGRSLSHNLLGAFFLSFGLNIFDGYCLYRGIYLQFPRAGFWLNALPALFGPLLYFYTKSVLYSDFRLRWRHAWHTLLFWMLFGLLVVVYHVHSTDYQREFLQRAHTYTGAELIFGNVVILAHIGLYIFLAYRETFLYQRALRHRFSNVEERSISWLRFMLLSNVLLYFFLMFYIGAKYTVWSGQLTLSAVIGLSVVFLLFVSSALFRALMESEVFGAIPEAESTRPKYAYSDLTKTESQASYERLLHLMETERPWLDPNLTLADLAEKFSMPAKTLSQVINESADQHFFDFVNRHRIAAAQALLQDPKNDKMTILEILYEVGFNSKSSFNTAFRKYAGTTPTAYRKRFAGK